MTERSENLAILMSENGRRSYFFETALLEGYTMAADPYREFRKGIRITTYKSDSLTTVNAVLTANYAIYYEKRELWEAKGDVVVDKADGTKLYTQQLFWNSKTGRIYSNVDSKIVKGTDVFMGEGFESDEELKDWRFRRMSGKMLVNMEPTENPDSTAVKSSKSEQKSEAKSDSKRSEKSSATVQKPVKKSEDKGSQRGEAKQIDMSAKEPKRPLPKRGSSGSPRGGLSADGLERKSLSRDDQQAVKSAPSRKMERALDEPMNLRQAEKPVRVNDGE
jgi:LPS export ABC transporter protein LptC